jgi:hypothetical protein
VKNNLQTVSSLLSMAAMGTKNREAGDLLRDAESRVHAMALIHSQLYGSQRLDRIDVKRNIRELADRLSSIYSSSTHRVVHTGEGNEQGPTLCLKGVDNPTYYRLTGNPAMPYRYYMNSTGCGNTIDFASAQVIRFM